MKRLRMLFCCLAIACLSVCLLVGCSSSGSSSSTQTVEDAYGRTVDVPSTVEKVVTVGSGARFVVYAGAQDKLVAVTQMETEASPSRPYTVAYKDLFSSLPATSNGNHLLETNVDTETLLSLKPDVIVSSRSAEECDKLQSDTGIPVIGISYQDQMFSDDVYASISAVGKALGTSDHADRVVTAMKDWSDDLQNRTADIPDSEKPTVYAGAVNYKGQKSFDGTYAHYAPFEAVNIKNVVDSTGQTGAVQISLEQLGEWNPDYMFLNMANKTLMDTQYEANKDFFDSLNAFKSGNLYSQPSYNMNGTNIETAICDAYFVGATVYPQAFDGVDMEAKYAEIYQTMLGSNYYETMKSSGSGFKKVSF